MPYSEFFDLLDKGGLLVWPIALCSVLGMSIFIERLLHYRKVYKYSIRSKNHQHVLSLIRAGQLDQAHQMARNNANNDDAANRIILEALSLENPDRETLEFVLIHAVEREVERLTKNLSTLGVLASVAPLLGLLGTVMGMIKAFIVVQRMGGGVNASVLAGGIWEAMLTTAMGLLVAIPLLFFHNNLEAKLRNLQAVLEDVAIACIKSWSRQLTQKLE